MAFKRARSPTQEGHDSAGERLTAPALRPADDPPAPVEVVPDPPPTCPPASGPPAAAPPPPADAAPAADPSAGGPPTSPKAVEEAGDEAPTDPVIRKHTMKLKEGGEMREVE